MSTKQDDGKSKPSQQQQQHAASGEGKQYGEGSYSGARQYNEGLKEHVENHDIEKDARDAAPRSDAEEKEMEEAERIGRSRSRDSAEKPSDDGDDEESVN